VEREGDPPWKVGKAADAASPLLFFPISFQDSEARPRKRERFFISFLFLSSAEGKERVGMVSGRVL